MIRHPRELEILVATRNAGKIREIRAALSLLPIRLVELDQFPGMVSVDEVGQTYQENAALKALGYARQSQLFALADDSGLEVDALGGQPGVFSARFAGPDAADAERNEKLLAALSGYDGESRSARFVCSMALAGWPPSERPVSNDEPHVIRITEAKCEGAIAFRPRGEHGFGFDPLFVPNGYNATFGELPDDVKARISHRALALVQMREFLKQWLLETSAPFLNLT
jgi:XTP/dITP diphosphohydrolase